MIALFAVAIHLKWMTLFGGIIPIITWILVACFFTIVFGLDFIFTITYHLKNINKKLKNS